MNDPSRHKSRSHTKLYAGPALALTTLGLLIACTGTPRLPDPAEPAPPAVLTEWAALATLTAAPVPLIATATLAPGDPWTALRARPLALPTIAPGAPCPTTPGHVVAGDFGPALGDGPIYPVGLGTGGVLYYGGAAFPPPWHGQKVLWVGAPSYQGLALVRGHQLDGANELRFGDGANPASELQLTPSPSSTLPSGWHNWPSHTRLVAPGCYAYQVDAPTFSKVIIFRAVDGPPPP